MNVDYKLNLETEQKIIKIAQNCWLTMDERGKLAQMTINTNERNRDRMLDDILKVSENRDVLTRRLIKDKIRDD